MAFALPILCCLFPVLVQCDKDRKELLLNGKACNFSVWKFVAPAG